MIKNRLKNWKSQRTTETYFHEEINSHETDSENEDDDTSTWLHKNEYEIRK